MNGIDQILIKPKRLRGVIDVKSQVPSKSMFIRGVLANALAGGDLSDYKRLARAQDALAAMDCADSLLRGENVFYVRESATLLRLLIPIALSRFHGGKFILQGTLKKRTLEPFYSALPGVSFDIEDNLLTVSGRLDNDRFLMRGDISSQFVSGMLMALALIGYGRLELTSPLASKSYVNMTINVLKRFGIHVFLQDGAYVISHAKYKAYNDADWIEGDWSFAAYSYALNFAGNDITVQNMLPYGVSMQGDSKITTLLGTRNIDIDSCIDLFPPLCIAATATNGVTRFFNCNRLRLKECDRLKAMEETLNALGVRTNTDQNSFVVYGTGFVDGGTVFAHNDHRIAMAAALLSALARSPITLLGALDAVKKSVPDFFEIFTALGGEYEYLG